MLWVDSIYIQRFSSKNDFRYDCYFDFFFKRLFSHHSFLISSAFVSFLPDTSIFFVFYFLRLLIFCFSLLISHTPFSFSSAVYSKEKFCSIDYLSTVIHSQYKQNECISSFIFGTYENESVYCFFPSLKSNILLL